MDKLEDYIREKREELDRYSPPEKVWDNIRKVSGKKRPINRRWINIAAMFVIVAGISVLLFKPVFRWQKSDLNYSSAGKYSLTDPQLKETENYYNNLVNSLYKEANPFLTKYPDIRKELNNDLSHLDSICGDIKRDLKDNVSNKEVVEALIRNYRIKIHILEDMLSVLKDNDSIPEKKKNHEL